MKEKRRAIFVPESLRNKIKKEATKNNRTMVGELLERFK